MRIIGENNVEEDTDKAQIVARTLPISAASSNGVTMTLTNASGSPVSGVMDNRGWIDTTKMPDEALTLTVTAGDITKTYKLSKESGGTNPDPDPEEPADSFYYNWDFTDDAQYGKNAEGMVTLASKADENTLTYTQKTATHNAAAGLSNNSGEYFSMEKAVTLSDKAKWTIEWRGVQKTNSNGLLLSNNDSDWTGGDTRTTPYLYLRNGGDSGAYDVSYCYEGTFAAEGNKLFNLMGTEHENDLSFAAWSLSCDGNGNLTLTNDKNYSETVKINGPVTYNGVLGRFGSISPLCYSGTIECLKIYSADRAADSFYYNWDFTDNEQYNANTDGKVTLASKADKNTLTYTEDTATHDAAAGLSNDNGQYFSMEKDVTLSDTAKWTIEWRGVQKTGNNGLLLSNNNSDYGVDGRTTPYLYLRNGGDHGAYDVSYCYGGIVGAARNQLFDLKGTDFENNLATAAWSLSCDGNKTLTLTNDKGYSKTVTIDGPVTYNGVLGRFGSSLTLCYSGTIEYVKIYSADRAAEAATQRDYYWDFTKVDNEGNLAAETTDHWSKNVLTGSANVGTVQNDGLKHTSSNDHFTMENAAVLPKDKPWTIEWQGRTSAQSILLANNNDETDATSPRKAGEYVYIFNDYRTDRPEDNGISLRDQNTQAAATFNGIPVDIRENANTVWYLIHDGNGNLKLAATVNGVTFTSEATNAIKRDYTFNGVLGYFTQNNKLNYDGEIKYLKIYHSAADITSTAAELTMDVSNIGTTDYEAGQKFNPTGLVVKLGDQELEKYDVVCKPAILAEGSNTVTITVSYMGQTVSETVTVVTPRTFTVTFDVDGKTTEVPVKENKTVTAPSAPEKTGYTFKGWYLNGKEFNFGTPITGNITLTAAWETVQYTITYDLADGTVAGTNPTEYNITSSDITLINPTKTGYTFKGWSGTDLTGDGNESVTIPAGSTGGRSYTANWTANTYTVTFDKNAADATLGTANKNVTYGETYSDLPTPVRAGFNFAGWFTAAAEGEKIESSDVCMTANDHTLYAHWTAKEIPALKITATPNTLRGGGKVTLTVDAPKDAGTITVKYKAASSGDETTLTPNGDGKYAVTLPNRTETYTFTVFCAENDKYAYNTVSCTVSVTRRHTSSVTPGNTVSVPSTPNGTVTVSPSAASKGETVTITTKPNEGYELGSIEVLDKNGDSLKLQDLSNGKYSFVMPDGKVSVEAEFVKTAATSFADVPANAYFADAVKWAVDKGITNGLSDTMFGPYESCTRAQIVTFLWRAAGSPEPKAMGSFTDVPASAYYAKAVAWAVENGITNGMTETTFAPNATCTRGQSVTFLYRALKGTASGSTNFTDVKSDAFYADAINWAVANNVTNGTSNTTFSPSADCTRAEIVTFLYRAYQGK